MTGSPTPKPTRKHLPHALPTWVDVDDAVYFITLTCRERERNQLCQTEAASAIFDAAAHYVVLNKWHPRLLLLMPDHLHMIVTFNLRKASVRGIVEPWKGWIHKQTGILWQRGFFDHRLRGQQAVQEKADYVLLNPVRKGLASTPDAWPWMRIPPW